MSHAARSLQKVILFNRAAPSLLSSSNSARQRVVRKAADSRLTPAEKILSAVAEYAYLTSEQITRLLYAPGSLTYVQEQMKSLVDSTLLLPLGGRARGLPRIYTLSSKGSSFLGSGQRIRPSEEQDKTPPFLAHTLLVNDLLIGAQLVSQTVPGIVLNRMVHERELRGKISVAIAREGNRRKLTLIPDASVDFTVNKTWRYFFHVEVFRNPPAYARIWKQKVAGYLAAASEDSQQELFATKALAVAVVATSAKLAKTLKAWTEEVLAQQSVPDQGQRFFFSSIDPATASPSEMYLTPVWQHPFQEGKTPLLLLEEGEQ